ncbi:MAG TPA: hypothetical protein VFA27_03525 [Vicinamibacterales bacterium]|nr:hypothetical protein [Vicinamibacterales bacterium]
MAKKRSSSRAILTLKPLVKTIDSHIKKLQKAKKKKGNTPQQRKALDKHIGHLRRVRGMTTDGCDDFIVAV